LGDHAERRAGDEQIPDEAEQLRGHVEPEMLRGAAVELHIQTQSSRQTLTHDRDAEEDAGVTAEQREGGVEDLSHRHGPQLHGSHWSSFAVKMPPRCRTREPRPCRNSRGVLGSRRRSTSCSSSSSRASAPAWPRPCATPASSPSRDRKSTRLNSSHQIISYAVFCLKKKKHKRHRRHNSDLRYTHL